ncbi:unnamed protein product [Adineta ricciae]|uniref:Uncharacterized protein n=1 Tax=Adineta ricciae TaxID=249248 RepID=A0A814LK34_ADIRI|nr:unnamed protein product [Adineta ricciae]
MSRSVLSSDWLKNVLSLPLLTVKQRIAFGIFLLQHVLYPVESYVRRRVKPPSCVPRAEGSFVVLEGSALLYCDYPLK